MKRIIKKGLNECPTPFIFNIMNAYLIQILFLYLNQHHHQQPYHLLPYLPF